MIERRVLKQPLNALVCREVLFLGRLGAILLGVALASLVPLAHASPPDPTWIPGLYDDADHDDAVIAITEANGFPARDALAIVPAALSHTAIAFAGPERPGKPARISLLDRSPPLS